MNIVVSKSLAEVTSLIRLVNSAYEISFFDGYLLHSRENDVYKLLADNRTCLLKIYPVNGMQEPKIKFIDSIVSAAYDNNYIVRTKAGHLQNLLSYPEGNRVSVLFEYIESVRGNYREYEFYRFGAEIARIHSLDIEENKPEKTSCSDIEEIIVEANLNHNEKFKLLEILSFVESFPKDNLDIFDTGLCHGDCHIENAVETQNGMRLIDFDHMCVDYFAGDLTSMIWANHYGMGVKTKDLEKFFEGYSSKRNLPKFTKDTLLYFFMKKEIFYISSYLKRQRLVGEIFVNSNLVFNRVFKLREFNDTHKINDLLSMIFKYS